MAERLKDCLIVRAISICMKYGIVNGFGDGSALWIGKPPDWICYSEAISFWIKNAPVWSVQNKRCVFIMFSFPTGDGYSSVDTEYASGGLQACTDEWVSMADVHAAAGTPEHS